MVKAPDAAGGVAVVGNAEGDRAAQRERESRDQRNSAGRRQHSHGNRESRRLGPGLVEPEGDQQRDQQGKRHGSLYMAPGAFRSIDGRLSAALSDIPATMIEIG